MALRLFLILKNRGSSRAAVINKLSRNPVSTFFCVPTCLYVCVNIKHESESLFLRLNPPLFLSVGWQKVNVDPVCFGVKNDSFGIFEIHRPGDIYRLKLVHRSGYVNCAFPTALNTKWGCAFIDDSYYSQKLNVHITNENNTRIFPANVSGSLVLDDYFFYTLLGFDENSAEIVFDSTPIPLSVFAGQKFRIWYGEDLEDKGDHNNMGTSCTDVYAFRQ